MRPYHINIYIYLPYIYFNIDRDSMKRQRLINDIYIYIYIIFMFAHKTIESIYNNKRNVYLALFC